MNSGNWNGGSMPWPISTTSVSAMQRNCSAVSCMTGNTRHGGMNTCPCRKIPVQGKKAGETRARRKELSGLMDSRRKGLGLCKNGFESWLKVCGKRYARLLSSQQVQAEAGRVWVSVEKYLFGNGRYIHFKKYMNFQTVGGKSNQNGAVFDRVSLTVRWNGLVLACCLPKKPADRDYLLESMDHKLSYCIVKRLMFQSGWRYYLVLLLDGPAPVERRECGNQVMGIDPGVSTIAGVSDTECILTELAPEADVYDKHIRRILSGMDQSRKNSNPENYLPDGTVKKGRKTWKYSQNYLRMRRKLKTLYRKKAACILTSHRELCNTLIRKTGSFLVEKMYYSGLQKRSGKTERHKKTSVVKTKSGEVKQIRKYKKKKRFGRSISRRAPALFLKELERKTLAAGGTYAEVSTQSFKASQYDHVTGTCKKIQLKQREKLVGGHLVQRDLYSAFLIRNAAPGLDHPDRGKCIQEFEKFVTMQDALIRKMKEEGISRKACFGF